jgi:hypothetical protein
MAVANSVVRIVSGGQTGVDRAALDVALTLGIPCGGWVPRGRRAEDGRVPRRYPMRECASSAYEVRTRLNVRDSDATLVLTRGRPSGGTLLTMHLAGQLTRPCLLVDLDAPPEPAAIGEWLRTNEVKVLNVAGPRESSARGIHGEAMALLLAVFNEGAANPATGRSL